MGQGHAQGFRDYLRGRSCSQELAATAWSGAGAAAHLRRRFQGDLLMGITGPNGLYFACIFARLGQEGDPTGDKDGRQFARRSQRHHHRRQPFVAGRDADHAHPGGQGPHQAAQHDGRVIAKGKRIEHAGGALGAPITRIGAGAGEGNGIEGFQSDGCFGHQRAQFPVPGVKAESDGCAIRGAQAAVGAEDENFGAEQFLRLPSHTRILAQPEEIA